MNLNLLMEQGISRIIKTAGRFYMHNPQGRAFLSGIIPALKKSAVLRKEQEEQGLHIPPFLIASIASRCNLRCSGCYARADNVCRDGDSEGADLEMEQWRAVFAEAVALGISFILLAGGEPLLRPDVLKLAATFSEMIFPVFTNGTMLDEEMLALFDRHRNLIPIFSIEGGQQETDARRGAGIYAQVERVMAELKRRRILFGASVTVTRENIEEVTAIPFATAVRERGCGLLLYVEYVPVEKGTEHLALKEAELTTVLAFVLKLKRQFSDMVVLSFPGDEVVMGGCLASGRGFFHINPRGDAEPCPFAPYSKHNLQRSTIVEVLRSGFFEELRELAMQAEHNGGCTLFDHQAQVAYLAKK